MDLINQYNQYVLSGNAIDNVNQRAALNAIAKFFDHWFIPRFPMVYLWGSVGSGKTFCMDFVYDCFKGRKHRWHYSDWVTHMSLHEMSKISSNYTWAEYVRSNWQRGDLFCLDEWVIEDITQAMMWKNILPLLMKRGVYLFFTTNVAPNQIYQDRLGREHLLNMIKQISTQATIINLDQTFDFRAPLKKHERLKNQSKAVFPKLSKLVTQLPFEKGELPVIKKNHDCIYLDFKTVIKPPIWRHNYLEWASGYKNVFLHAIDSIQANKNHLANWVRFVDILYDAQVNVFCDYTDGLDQFIAKSIPMPERTISRLRSWVFYQEKLVST